MITKIKLFENINKGEPEIGDYVILSFENTHKIYEYINNSLGLIIDGEIIKYENCDEYNYIVFYKDMPDEFNKMITTKGTILVAIGNIKYWNNNKTELESILATNKFNI